MSSAESIVTAGSDDSGIGTVAWSTPENITTSVDSNWATANLGFNQTSHYLKGLMSTPLAVQAGSTINGIEVEIHKNMQAGIGTIKDSVVKLVKGGTIGGNNNADTSTTWHGSTNVLVTYGSSSDLWGQTWTVSDVNATNFGAVIAAINSSVSSDTARVDDMLLRVYYTLPGLAGASIIHSQAVSRAANY